MIWGSAYICWNDPRDARMDPPIHDPYLLSCGPLAAISLNLMVDGVLMLRSRFNLSMNPLRHVFPPVTTTLPYRAGLRSTSHMPTLVVTTCPAPNIVPGLLPRMNPGSSVSMYS